ncbi:RIP metalloprotease RseP [Portibacter lacus]|uniref:Zinc metalloprotease n=1 Tax=Portibacter lacus TaxID=1099794 RepID=A0AA37SP01_9BACT|nr:RIP metalloprotease RseP [Portibacter lacus]GLR17275.1 zinc metalloprotease [Portibacter lacus]
MDILIKALQLILSLSILVVLHELGHFLPAKWFKTKVEKFYLFFNPGFSLFKKQIGETEYGIGWLPLGGYVKIAGMIDESMDKEFLDAEPEPWEFRSKPAWQRLIIMLGGVTVNIILGYFIFTMIAWTWGSSYVPASEIKDGIYVDSLGYEMGLRTGDKILQIGDAKFEKFNPSLLIRGVIIDDARSIDVIRDGSEINIPIDEKYVHILTGEGKDQFLFGARTPFEIGLVAPESAAEKAGLKVDDKIIEYNGNKVDFYDQLALKAREFKNKSIDIKYERDGQVNSTVLELDETGKMGLLPQSLNRYFKIEKETYGFVESISIGVKRANGFVKDQINAFGKIFRGKIKAKDSLGSFLSIGNMFPSAWDWQVFWSMTAMLSMILGILNLLPIPGLDGGHVVFLIWEVVTGKKVSDKVVEYATMVGFVLLIILMVFALGNDIRRFWPF